MEVKWPQIIDKYIGKPYELGGWGNPGYDCFSLLITLFKESGLYLPQETEWNGLTATNYPVVWKKDMEKAKKLFKGFVSNYLIPHSGPAQQGDVVLTTVGGCMKYDPFYSMHVSNKIISASKEYGVRGFPLKYFIIREKYRINYEIS